MLRHARLATTAVSRVMNKTTYGNPHIISPRRQSSHKQTLAFAQKQHHASGGTGSNLPLLINIHRVCSEKARGKKYPEDKTRILVRGENITGAGTTGKQRHNTFVTIHTLQNLCPITRFSGDCSKRRRNTPQQMKALIYFMDHVTAAFENESVRLPRRQKNRRFVTPRYPFGTITTTMWQRHPSWLAA